MLKDDIASSWLIKLCEGDEERVAAVLLRFFLCWFAGTVTAPPARMTATSRRPSRSRLLPYSPSSFEARYRPASCSCSRYRLCVRRRTSSSWSRPLQPVSFSPPGSSTYCRTPSKPHLAVP
ncbi:hypothetical protein Cni_G15083 [Canna indica]|uniref:Uncharacterized protein n=1 Tax=Canna indica TaxID=4628 RepID=A0AAQ3QB86_9LILI|nr:hypothetical protein Cni_G15083 [Canna indica]